MSKIMTGTRGDANLKSGFALSRVEPISGRGCLFATLKDSPLEFSRFHFSCAHRKLRRMAARRRVHARVILRDKKKHRCVHHFFYKKIEKMKKKKFEKKRESKIERRAK